MAGIAEVAGQSGLTVYFVIRNRSAQAWNGASFEAFNASNWGTYDIAATEQSSTGYYTATFPSSITAGKYTIVAHAQTGGSPAVTDPVIGQGSMLWDGSAEEEGVGLVLEAYRLDEAIDASAGATPAAAGSFFDLIMNKNVGQTFDRSTDSLEAIKDAGGGGPSVADIADGVWDELLNSGHAVANSAAVYLKAIYDKLPSGVISDFDSTVDRVDLNASQTGVTIGEVEELGATARGQVKDQIDTALGTDTLSELTAGVPASTPTIKAALTLLYMALRNKRVETGSESKIYDNAGNAIAKATTTDNGTEFTKDKFGAP